MTKRIYALTAIGLLLADQAFAQLAGGSIDPNTTAHNLLTYGIPLGGVVIAAISIKKGVMAAADGRHIGPAIGGLLSGIGIAFGGPYIVQHATGFMG